MAGSTFDFGSQNCGTVTFTGQELTLTDGADAGPYAFTASLQQGAASPFSLSSDEGTVEPGGSAQITITPNPLPASTSVPGLESDVLTIAPLPDAGGPTLSYTVQMTVTGALLVWGTEPSPYTNAVDGETTESESVTILNNGNLPATPVIALTSADGGGPFSLAGQLSGPIGALGSGSVNVGYAPGQNDEATASSPDSATVSLSDTTDVICGSLPAPFAVTGVPITSGITVSPTEVDLPTILCNSTGTGATSPPAAVAVTITNSNSTTVSFTAALGQGTTGPFSLAGPDAGSVVGTINSTLPANSQVTLMVNPQSLAYPLSTSADAYGDSLTVTTNAPNDLAHSVTLTQGAQGAVLAVAPDNGVQLGSVYQGTSVQASTTVSNSGNVTVGVTAVVSGVSGIGTFSATPSASTAVSPNGSIPSTISYAAPAVVTGNANPAAATVTVTPASGAPLCGPPPAGISLAANATDVAIGIAPAAGLVFTGPSESGLPAPSAGDTYCGTTAAPITVTVTNLSSSVSFNVTGAAFADSPTAYTISPAPSTTSPVLVAAGQSVTFTVTSEPVPATWDFQTPALDFDDTLTLTTDLAGDSPHALGVTQSPYGAVLTDFLPNPPSLDFTAPGGGTEDIDMALTNNGNAPATITFIDISQGTAPAGTFGFSQSYVLAAGDAIAGSPSFEASFSPPVGVTTYTGGTAELSTTGTPLCGPLPASNITMQGTVTNKALYTVTPTSIAFNVVGSGQGTAVPCGATTGLPTQNVTITNSSGATIDVAPSIAAVTDENGNAETFTLTPSGTLVIPNGDQAVLTITAAPVPTPTGTHTITMGAALYSTNLTLTVSGGATGTTTIPVTVYPYGTLLEFNPGTVTSNGKNGTPANPVITKFRVRNLGYEAGNVSLLFAGPPLLSLVQVAQAPNATAQTATNGESVTLTAPRYGQGGSAGITEEISNAGVITGASSVTLSLTSGYQCQAALPVLAVTVK